jgi:hypothetical protein
MNQIRCLLVTAAALLLPQAYLWGQQPSQDRKTAAAEEELQKIQQALRESFSKGPKAAADQFERVLAEDAIITGHDGIVHGKKGFLKEGRSGDRGPITVEERELKTQLYGETAVLTGRWIIKTPLEPSIRFTHVYARKGKQWLLVTAHYSMVQRR